MIDRSFEFLNVLCLLFILQSLCNACGIRYRKKKSTSGSDKKKSPSPTTSSSSSSSCSMRIGEDDGERNNDLRKKLRIKLVALGKEVVLWQRQRSGMKKVRRNDYKKLGEVEQAAFLLMSLSYDSVFA